MALNFGFFSKREHKVFNYKPRYYDPKKEEWERRKAELKVSDKDEDKGKKDIYVPGTYAKGSLTGGRYKKTKEGSKIPSIIAILSLILFFVILIYFVKFFRLLW